MCQFTYPLVQTCVVKEPTDELDTPRNVSVDVCGVWVMPWLTKASTEKCPRRHAPRPVSGYVLGFHVAHQGVYA
jgi:hypothetical protein